MGESQHPSNNVVDVLILGLGWTSQFLVPLLDKDSISHMGTTRDGRNGSLKFNFDYDASTPEVDQKYEDTPSSWAGDTKWENDHSKQLAQFHNLPTSQTLLITFPIKGKQAMKFFYDCYLTTHKGHPTGRPYLIILLGTSGIYQIPGQTTWVTRHSKYDTKSPRAEAEDWLISKGHCALNLCGLWGGERSARNWIDRVAATKDQLATKKTVQMIHGLDVARAILAVHYKFGSAKGQRWLLTDMVIYDWWELILGFGGELDLDNGNDERMKKQVKWVFELMKETGTRALPRGVEVLGRGYDTVEFWDTFGLIPTKARLSTYKP